MAAELGDFIEAAGLLEYDPAPLRGSMQATLNA